MVNQPSRPLVREPRPQQLVAVKALLAQSGANELRTASGPCCACPGDGAGGSAVVGLDPDVGLMLPLGPAGEDGRPIADQIGVVII